MCSFMLCVATESMFDEEFELYQFYIDIDTAGQSLTVKINCFDSFPLMKRKENRFLCVSVCDSSTTPIIVIVSVSSICGSIHRRSTYH